MEVMERQETPGPKMMVSNYNVYVCTRLDFTKLSKLYASYFDYLFSLQSEETK